MRSLTEPEQYVVLLADMMLMDLPLEALSILQEDSFCSVSRDFSLQLLHSRLRDQPDKGTGYINTVIWTYKKHRNDFCQCHETPSPAYPRAKIQRQTAIDAHTEGQFWSIWTQNHGMSADHCSSVQGWFSAAITAHTILYIIPHPVLINDGDFKLSIHIICSEQKGQPTSCWPAQVHADILEPMTGLAEEDVQ